MSKNILITGANGQLGTVVAQHLARTGDQIAGTIREIHPDLSSDINWFEADLTNADSVDQLFIELKERFSKLDAALLFAGGFDMSNIENSRLTQLDHMLKLNLYTAFLVAQQTYNWMKETGGGHLILIGAKPAIEKGFAETLPYALSKTSVIKMAELLNESGKEHQIRASVLVPSIIDTPANRTSMPDAHFEDWVHPDQIAATISFLLSADAQALRETVIKLYGNS